MMRTIIFSVFTFFLVFGTVQAQLKVESTGQVDINGQGGNFLTQAPRVTINSAGTDLTSDNTGFSLYNNNTTLNNWTRFNFAAKRDNGSIREFASVAVQYKNKNSLYYEGGDFHIATLNRGFYDSRLLIYNNPSSYYDVKFLFNTGYTGGSGTGRGVWLDDSGMGEPTFRPNNDSYGFLGTSSHAWYNLYVYNAYYNHHSTIMSDKRNKSDIETIDHDVLSKLNNVRGVRYRVETKYDTSDINFDSENTSISEQDYATKRAKEKELKKAGEKERFGFLAQELIEVFPEVVAYDSVNDRYGIQYTALIPVMIEGMKAQQSIIDAQSLKIKELASKIEESESAESKSGTFKSAEASLDDIGEENSLVTNAFLYQNNPNPFTYDTEIGYYIPEGASQATLYVFNLQGKLLITEPIAQTGQGAVTISGTSLDPGMYVYALYIDGQEVDSKRMVLTE